ncbi:MAG: tetraacyldisaccharide 4'-kinase [Desulfocapsaceae bacterium]|jgi:tetraacyldisaccharide 4'-kinase|nr:tetraacyldisaccharide 4'-kinase [Desulfocapsaceae bacterium]
MNPALKKTAFAICFPFSPFYSQLMVLRAFLYRKRIISPYESPVPVISVGNLTMGGTGKTPLVMYLARYLNSLGYKPAIVSRGYRGKAKAPVTVVSDGATMLTDADQGGDEPWLMANELPGVVVATGKNRIFPCRHVVESYQCDIIILDDGFQHLKVSRSIDLVLFDVDVFAGNSRVFPAGELREPVSALNRCHAFVLTGNNQTNRERADMCAGLLQQKFQDKALFRFTASYNRAYKYYADTRPCRRETIPVNALPGNLYCFSGIANPQRFKNLIEENKISVSGFKIFNDHHGYSEKDIRQLAAEARLQNANALLTTEKDMSKISNLEDPGIPIFTLPVALSENHDFNDFITQKLSV